MRVDYNQSDGLPDPAPGPTDDGYIAVAVNSVPQDPLCCTGPNITDDGAHASQKRPCLHAGWLERLQGSCLGGAHSVRSPLC